MKKIRIAYITREDARDKSKWSGSSYNIYNCLLKTGHKIELIGPINSFFEKFLKIIEIFYRYLGIKFDPQRNIYLSKILAKKINKKIISKKIDLILVHDCPLISFLNTGIPIIIWTDLTFDLYQKTYFKNYKKFHFSSLKNGDYLERLSLNKARKLIYTTKYAKANAKIKYNINSKIDLLQFGSDFFSISKKNFLRLQNKKIKNKKNLIKFLSVGVDWNRKNMNKSIKVVNEINRKGLNCSLTIVGAKPPKNLIIPKFLKIIPFLNKNNINEFKKLKKIYLNSDYFILLSKAEAFGLVILEASSFGLPLILNNLDGMKYLADKKYCLFVDKNISPKKIALKILKLERSEIKYKQFSYNSYLSSKSNNWNNISKKLNKIIENTLLEDN